MFDRLLNELNEQGAGVRAYEACARTARALIPDETDKAAALLIISIAAQRFVDAYDEQPLTVEAAGEEFEQFNSMITTLEDAYATGPVERKLAALNAVATQLASETKGG